MASSEARGRDRGRRAGPARAAAPPRTREPGLLRRLRPAPAGRRPAGSPRCGAAGCAASAGIPATGSGSACRRCSSRSPARRSRSRSPTTSPAKGGTTIVAVDQPAARSATQPSSRRAASLPAAPEPTAPARTARPRRRGAASSGPNGRLTLARDARRLDDRARLVPARARPRRAARRPRDAPQGSACPEVGVLESSDFSSLHPGYAIVFSGIYSSRADAEAALTSARATGFGTAYTREISR